MAKELSQLHPRARTTRAQRRQIQQSEESDRALAARMGVNVKTVAKWRKRASIDDAPMGPKRSPEPSLNPGQEAAAVVLRKLTRASVQRLQWLLLNRISHMTLSTLYRCLRKWRVSSLPRVFRTKGAREADLFPGASIPKPSKGAQLRIFVNYLMYEEHKYYLWTCISASGDWFYADTTEELGAHESKHFLDEVLADALFPVSTIVTGPLFVFCRRPEAPELSHPFRVTCQKHGLKVYVDPDLPAEPAPVSPGWKDVLHKQSSGRPPADAKEKKAR